MFFRALVVSKGFARSFATAAGDGKPFSIPVINFSKYRNAKSDAEKQQTATDIVSAFKESGFVYLTNHGIPQGEFRPSSATWFAFLIPLIAFPSHR